MIPAGRASLPIWIPAFCRVRRILHGQGRDKGNIANETAASAPMSAVTNAGPTLPSPAAYWMLNETSGSIAADSSVTAIRGP